MNRILPLLVATALVVTSLPPGHAGESGRITRTVTGDLTLDRAVQIALRQNPDILKALQEIERTRGQVIEVRAQALPHLSATATYNQQDKELLESGGSGQSGGGNIDLNDFTASGTGSELNSTLAQSLADFSNQNQGSGGGINNKSWQVSLEVRQVLYAGGQVRAAMRIAKLTEDNSYWMLRDTVDRVISQTRTQFFDVLLNHALINVAEESVTLQEDQLKDQKNRFDAGAVAKFNVLRAEVELAWRLRRPASRHSTSWAH
jgi:outer membrane protein